VDSFFKTLVEHEITVELKNEVQIRGTLKSVDQYLNIKLDNAEAVDEMRWPHLVSSHTWHTGASFVDKRCSARPKTCLFADLSSATYTSRPARSTQHCSRMRRGERQRQQRTRPSEGIHTPQRNGYVQRRLQG
jgi:small nuclear ribonucleoprotein (snRNP)-like protein